MKALHLSRIADQDGVTRLEGTLDAEGLVRVHYDTRTGALLRVNGAVAGAFDREHSFADVEAGQNSRIELDVENASLPTNALPSGPGLAWWWLNWRAAQTPSLQGECDVVDPVDAAAGLPDHSWPLIGHSHLDVAWLWTYAQAQRKALRTFAIAQNLLERYPEFVFTQSQPQLYEFVQGADPLFFERLVPAIAAGRIDASVAALWVESDCNLPSGESLLRQMLYAHEYCTRHFSVVPNLAWLPDSFGFCNTLPTLLAHAGIPYFATTKLQWNDTTQFAHPQFVWRGPDGSAVLGAVVMEYEGGVDPGRLRRARERKEPLVAGFGDGGGGVTAQMIETARTCGRWITLKSWFEQLEPARANLPVYEDELYLEYHRGVYTTHHDIKARNAALERKLRSVEEAVAWCLAVRAPRDIVGAFRAQIDEAWKIVLRNQFHDVLPGTSIAAVYQDVHQEYDMADALLEGVHKGTKSVLPRAAARVESAEPIGPIQQEDGLFVFNNGLLSAQVSPAGIISHLAGPDGVNSVSHANVLALYADRPSKWEAWNIDAGYDKRMMRPKVGRAAIVEGVLHVPFSYQQSTMLMQISLQAGEPFLRVVLDCDWLTRKTLLRVENWLPIKALEATYGTAHGTVARSAGVSTPAERAKYEVPGQRFAFARDARAGFACMSLDTYGWNARSLPKGGLRLGHSLLRGTAWPDPHADVGEHRITYAFVPLGAASIGELEEYWERFANEPRVRLFHAQDDAVRVVACKAAQNGEGVIVRIRECNGSNSVARIRCAGRMREVTCVDALERPLGGTVNIGAESLVAPIGAFGLRSFRVLF
ncbi:MAG: hypothetical protein M3N19_01390 [Candidatus Eremiobacteraeota bacterium]|nr:hypothetical protein [Candidatus Eremiobacteraeota bacterium]